MAARRHRLISAAFTLIFSNDSVCTLIFHIFSLYPVNIHSVFGQSREWLEKPRYTPAMHITSASHEQIRYQSAIWYRWTGLFRSVAALTNVQCCLIYRDMCSYLQRQLYIVYSSSHARDTEYIDLFMHRHQGNNRPSVRTGKSNSMTAHVNVLNV